MQVERGKARLLDEFLVASARTGDRKALSMLVERWHAKLVAHAWRLTGDPEVARDAAQAGWLDILRGLAGLENVEAFPAWAFRIVSRRCAGHVGRAVRRRDLEQALAEPPAAEVAPTADPLGMIRLRSAIADLPPDQRSAIALFYLEELSVAEVAVALAVPVGTIKTRLMHARRKLRAALEGEDQCVISTT